VLGDRSVRWDRLFHAYGPAGDAGWILEALGSGQDVIPSDRHEWWQQPYSFVWSALYCAGWLTPATAPALRHLARAVLQPDFGGPDPTIREGVVWLFREVARTVCTRTDLPEARRIAAARREPAVRIWLDTYLRDKRSILEWTEADRPGQVLLAAAFVECFDLLPELLAPVERLLAPVHTLRLRGLAASAAAMLTRHPQLAHRRPALLAYHLAECGAVDPHYRASMLLGAGELGGAPRAWLADPHPGVRVCAALAPALATDADAIEVLMSASRDPQEFATAFDTTVLPQILNHASTLAVTLCQRVTDFDRLVDSAIAAVGMPTPCYLPVGDDWLRGVLCEPYLRLAFPHGLPHPGTGTTAQRRFAAAVAAHEQPWQPDPAWSDTFERCRLPGDRATWLTVAGTTI
jgi:hypothetical protein